MPRILSDKAWLRGVEKKHPKRAAKQKMTSKTRQFMKLFPDAWVVRSLFFCRVRASDLSQSESEIDKKRFGLRNINVTGGLRRSAYS